MTNVDVAIIGGSLAGATCARELVRRGIDAVAFEREAFPREKVCGGFLSPGAVKIIDELGMLAQVQSRGATTVEFARIRTPGEEFFIPLPGVGLGISRRELDAVFAEHSAVRLGNVQTAAGSDIQVDDRIVKARVVVDAAGKLSRYTQRKSSNDFGIQFYEPGADPGVLDFWFFDDGYGGGVGVEGGRTNFCFLIDRGALRRYLSKPHSKVTGPIAYYGSPSPWIAIGDAAGMVDPFCGEGMRHALDTGRLAAEVIAKGFHAGRTYEEMKREYSLQRTKRWSRKRAALRWMRGLVRRPEVLRHALHLRPQWFLEKLWQ